MKRKILLAIILGIVFIMTFALCAFAVDYSEKATLADGEVLPIYDENQNPLIWWVSGTDANGNNVYSSVPNNRNEANADNDTYVTYTNASGNQLKDITIYIYDEASGAYVPYTDKDVKLVVVNLRGLTGFVYLHQNFTFSNIQYIYFHEELLDCCKFFAGSSDLRLVDLTVCTKMTGGFGGVRNFYQCSNLHTIRFAPTVSYSLKCTQNNNWRFSGTAVVSFVFPENITSLGIDNFKDNPNLESIYVLGNNTSLGQRNFSNCPKLTNIYILGDKPEITPTEFKENFFSCVDAGKTLDFSNTGKYFFFATTDTVYLEAMKAAIEATAVISYSDYKANPQSYTEGRYIISGTNVCDALYDGTHTLGETVNECQATCGRGCGALTVIENPTHKNTIKVTYDGRENVDYTKEVAVITLCERCATVENTTVIGKLFIEKGYSAQTDGMGIVREFIINSNAVESYKLLVDSSFEYGMVVAIANESPLYVVDDKTTTTSGAVVFANLSNGRYDRIQMKVANISADAVDTIIMSTVYARNDDEIYYVNLDGMSKTAEGKSYNTLNTDE